MDYWRLQKKLEKRKVERFNMKVANKLEDLKKDNIRFCRAIFGFNFWPLIKCLNLRSLIFVSTISVYISKLVSFVVRIFKISDL